MLAWYLLLSILTIGSHFTRFFFRQLELKSQIATWILSGVFITGWLLFISSYFLGYQSSLLIIIILNLILIIIKNIINRKESYNSFKCKITKIKQKLTKINWLFTLIFIFWLAIFSQLTISHNFFQKNNAYFTGGGAYGDLALHATLVYFFGLQPKLDLTSPIYSQKPTSYPFMIDFIAGQFLREGWSLQTSLVITSLPILVAFLFFTYGLMKTAGGSTKSWILMLFLFLFNGGIGILYFFQDWRKSQLNIWKFLINQPLQYAHIARKNIHWSNIVADYLLPQRGMIIGLALFSFFLMLFFKTSNAKKVNKKNLVGMSFLIGMSPWWHIHTFLTLMPLFIWSLFWWKKQKKLSIKIAILILLPALFLSIPQLYWQLSNTLNSNFIRFQFGWMKNTENFLMFWFKNMGISIFIWVGSILATYQQLQKHKKSYLILLFPLLILFVLTNLIIFQPHDYDNMKFMILAYLGVCSVASLWIEKHWPKKNFAKISSILLIIATCATGAISVIRETTLNWEIASQQCIKISNEIKEKTDPTGIFLSADKHNHPVTMLGGRKTLLGYRGWLWTHGINYNTTVSDMKLIFSGNPSALSLLDKYQIKYVYLGEVERTEWHANAAFFEKNFPKIIDLNGTQIFQIN